MTYTFEYMSMFYIARNALHGRLYEWRRVMMDYKTNGLHFDWELISDVAEILTAYNELSYVGKFFHLRSFKVKP